ncbi:diacylglycerol kinase family protein [Albimonas pacifica]|uniref:Diacylglycerol kinase catalytic domain-containing protein n=1 Tax=Albimonas pacifica TaxID=1114924 RepID=A0A1I3BPS9_9RHOB|nr:diacylglycerol kinase family protein [Albimonas pacifica]SFH64308.1 Diacylglycerol kinase catalytic domain-containing protein [Albimonas pacifica]
MRAARLRNPASARNRGRPATPLAGDVREVELTGPDRLDATLAALAAEGIELLIVDGGDGTLREIASRLPDAFPRPPRLAVIAGGNTNLVARHAGAAKPAEIARLRAGGGRERRLRLLRAEREGAPPLRGFILGWGAYETATRIAAEEGRGRGAPQVARTILATLRRAAFGAEATSLRRGVERGLGPGRALAGVATTLEGPLLPGLDPFWGEGDDPIRWTEAPAPAPHLALGLAFALAGRPTGWMRRAGYRSGRAATLELGAPAFVMDGERFEAAGPVRLSAAETLTFLS